MGFGLIPWKSLVRWLAKRHGFLDPIALISRLTSFGQPSEVTVPIELLRNALLLHARGLVNAQVIQHNLDWVWPYWVFRQFDPEDRSFLPRAFSVTHVNLTHRNWTAVGLPGCRAFPIVDPRGLVTPLFDGWSVDAWLLRRDGQDLLPARCGEADQKLHLGPDNLEVETRVSDSAGRLRTRTWVELLGEAPVCRVRCTAHDDSPGPAWLAVALRPFNPEGVSAIDELELAEDGRTWCVNGEVDVVLSEPPDRHPTSTYEAGDVHLRMFDRLNEDSASCKAGLATTAALYSLQGGAAREVTVEIDLAQDQGAEPLLPRGRTTPWADALEGTCRAELPDDRMEFLFNAAVRSLVLMSPGDAYPGPFTYRRFWFRDAALMLNALLTVGLHETAGDVTDRWQDRQSTAGYFRSQQGEWDSNGEVLWALWRMRRLTGRPLVEEWARPVIRAARWIQRKRTSPDGEALHAGLLPAGFSAEHLGNTDYYYWDDFWSVAGLRSAARLCTEWGEAAYAERFHGAADGLMDCIERSLEESRYVRRHPGMAASPYRRMDSGAVGSLVAGYPLGLFGPEDERLTATADYLLGHCMVDGAFFQDMIHSGLNVYLTLHIAQVLLRAGDERFMALVEAVADLASSTGQWPEAVHPHTGGGCMGDGQHVWAAAEWVMMLRNMFVREERDRLLLGSGISPEWRRGGEPLRLGPTWTPWGEVTVEVAEEPGTQKAHLRWEAAWYGEPPELVVAVPGMLLKRPEGGRAGSVLLRPIE